MNCSEFHEQAAALALDALPEDERLACEHHLAHEGPHEGCKELLARQQRAVARLSELVPSLPPPPAVWQAIELRAGIVPARASELPKRTTSSAPLAWAIAAAALLAAIWQYNQHGTATLTQQRERATLEQALASTTGQLAGAEEARRQCARALSSLTSQSALGKDAVALLEDPGTRVAPLSPAGGQDYRAVALYNPHQERALIVSSSMEPVAGRDYELWLLAGNDPPKPAGFLRFDGGLAIGELDPTLLRGVEPAAFAVSLEPEGGRPTPTEVVLLGKVRG